MPNLLQSFGKSSDFPRNLTISKRTEMIGVCDGEEGMLIVRDRGVEQKTPGKRWEGNFVGGGDGGWQRA